MQISEIPSQPASEFKRAAIDFLLAHGEGSAPWRDTGDLLRELAERGVDYDRCSEPDFGYATFDFGDTETDGKSGVAYTAQIVPVGARETKSAYREVEVESYTFYLPPSVLTELTNAFLVRALVAESSAGTRSWKDRI